MGRKVFQQPDHGYLVLLSGSETNTNRRMIGLEKTDSLGNVQWTRMYAHALDDYEIGGMLSLADANYIAGSHSDAINNSKAILLKTDTSGNILWAKEFGQTNLMKTLVGQSISMLDDGNLLLAGYNNNYNAVLSAYDPYLIKTDTAGNLLWSRLLIGNHGTCMAAIPSGTSSFCVLSNAGGWPMLTSMSNIGFLWWNKIYQSTDISHCIPQAISKCTNSDFMISGVIFSDSGYFYPYLTRTDSGGNVLWSRAFVGPGIVGETFSSFETPDHGFIMSFEPEWPCPTCRTGMIKTDSIGNVIWSYMYNLNNHNFPNYAINTADSGFAVTGYTNTGTDILLVKTDSLGRTGCYDSLVQVTSVPFTFFYTTGITLQSGDTTADLFPIETPVNLIMNDDCMRLLPDVYFTSAENSICPGTCADFLNLSINATSYQWSFPGASPGSSTAVSPDNICYSNPGTYDVQLIATNANGSDTLLLPNYITVYPSPPPQSISQSGDTLFAIAGATSYQWYFNGSIINGATDYFYVASASGDYNVVATDGNGCEVEAAIFSVTAGLQSTVDSPQLTIFPNPVIDKFTIHEAPCTIETACDISVYNMLGEKVLAVQLPPDSYRDTNSELRTMNVSQLPPGMYIVKIKALEKTYRLKFTKQ